MVILTRLQPIITIEQIYSYTTFCIINLWTVLQPIITIEHNHRHTTFYIMDIWKFLQPIIIVEQIDGYITSYIMDIWTVLQPIITVKHSHSYITFYKMCQEIPIGYSRKRENVKVLTNSGEQRGQDQNDNDLYSSMNHHHS